MAAMLQEPAQVSPAVDLVSLARDFLGNAQAQTQAAQAGDWTEVTRLAGVRDTLLTRLSAAMDGVAIAGTDRADAAGIFAQVQSLDREVATRAEAEMARLAAEIAATRRGRAVAAAYTRPGAAARHDLINRRG